MASMPRRDELLGPLPDAELAEPPRDELAEPPRGELAEPPRDELAEPPGDELVEPPRAALAEPPRDHDSVDVEDLVEPEGDPDEGPRRPVTNGHLARIFPEIGDILEVKGRTTFKTVAHP